MVSLLDRYVRIDDVVWFTTGEDYVIHNLENDQFLVVKDSGRLIWELLDGQVTLEEVVNEMCKAFEIDRKIAEEDCINFVNELERLKVIKLNMP